MPLCAGRVERIGKNSGWVEYTECSDQGNSEIDYQRDTIEPPVAEEDRAFVKARLAEHSAAVNGG